MEEEWRDIEGYEGIYQVSNMGNVRCMCNKGHYIRQALKKILTTKGYYQVQLYKTGKPKIWFVHRLVADAFIPNPQNKPNIDHINTITTDNRVENLRRCTQAENLLNPISHERRIKRLREAGLQHCGVNSRVHRPIYQYGLDGTFIRKWDTLSMAWKKLGFDSGCLTRAAQGKRLQVGGYQWRYVFAEKVTPYCPREKKIIQLTQEDVVVQTWNSIAEAAKYYKTSSGRICSCLRGITKTCRGFHWKYA